MGRLFYSSTRISCIISMMNKTSQLYHFTCAGCCCCWSCHIACACGLRTRLNKPRGRLRTSTPTGRPALTGANPDCCCWRLFAIWRSRASSANEAGRPTYWTEDPPLDWPAVLVGGLLAELPELVWMAPEPPLELPADWGLAPPEPPPPPPPELLPPPPPPPLPPPDDDEELADEINRTLRLVSAFESL